MNSISPLALTAKKVIDAAWVNGPAYDLSSQAAFALESAQLLQSPETAAETARLRGELAKALEQTAAARVRITELEADQAANDREYEAATARIAELGTRLAEYERPADEDPIAYTLTDKAQVSVDKLTRLFAPTQVLRADTGGAP